MKTTQQQRHETFLRNHSPLPDYEIQLAKELACNMGETAASYHIIEQLTEIERLKFLNDELSAKLDTARDALSLAREVFAQDLLQYCLTFSGDGNRERHAKFVQFLKLIFGGQDAQPASEEKICETCGMHNGD